MIEGVPTWVWVISAVLGSGFVSAVGPMLLSALVDKDKTKAEIGSMEADRLVKLEPVWAATVRQMQSEIAELRASKIESEMMLQAEIDELRARLDLYDALLRENGIAPPA